MLSLSGDVEGTQRHFCSKIEFQTPELEGAGKAIWKVSRGAKGTLKFGPGEPKAQLLDLKQAQPRPPSSWGNA